MALSPQWLDELRSRITLSALIGRTEKLQRAGREFKACCPFHNENTPSFYVNDEKQFYHCFGCGAHGDAIRWMTDQRGLPFMDAVKELAEQAGMEVPAPDPRYAQAAQQRASLHDVLGEAQAWFVSNLSAPEGAEARAYLKQRGISEAQIREFGFGFAPDAKGGIEKALSGFERDMLIEAGLLITVDGKEPYDRFRGRLMLPIQDRRARVIGFGGRILRKVDHAPKYLNSPDTPVFDKSRTLYNIHRASAASRQSERLVVVEGYMDVVALAGAGIAEAVAPMGTALTEQQIELLWRMVPVPVLCFDGDAAGQRAAMRAVERALPMLRPGHSLSIVTLPEGLDPDDLIRRDGPAAMKSLLGGGESLIDLIWRFEKSATATATPEAKAGLKERLMAHADAIQHPDIRALYARELRDRFSAFAFPPRQRQPARGFGGKLAGEFGGSRRFERFQRDNTPPSPLLRQLGPASARTRLMAAVILGLVRHPSLLNGKAEQISQLRPEDAGQARLLDALLELAETGQIGGGSLESPDIAAILAERGLALPHGDAIGGMKLAFLSDRTTPAEAAEELTEAISLLVERPAIEAALVSATARFGDDPEGSFAEQQRLLKRKLEFDARLMQMAAMRGGNQ
ncbi:MAG: DNA primase [Croceicoccus sp.]|nr:DNA primase [Croceicoccus sp.]|tara:strand:+ start:32169 stop:34052 length:1884 start_codon:yes stop_codon:yes gene_type:complete